MNKGEYLKRVFESQINSLEQQLKTSREELIELEQRIIDVRADHYDIQKLIDYALEEMSKIQ